MLIGFFSGGNYLVPFVGIAAVNGKIAVMFELFQQPRNSRLGYVKSTVNIGRINMLALIENNIDKYAALGSGKASVREHRVYHIFYLL